MVEMYLLPGDPGETGPVRMYFLPREIVARDMVPESHSALMSRALKSGVKESGQGTRYGVCLFMGVDKSLQPGAIGLNCNFTGPGR